MRLRGHHETDEHSPAGLTHMRNVIDINLCDRPDFDGAQQMAVLPEPSHTGKHGWDRLVSQLRSVVRT